MNRDPSDFSARSIAKFTDDCVSNRILHSLCESLKTMDVDLKKHGVLIISMIPIERDCSMMFHCMSMDEFDDLNTPKSLHEIEQVHSVMKTKLQMIQDLLPRS